MDWLFAINRKGTKLSVVIIWRPLSRGFSYKASLLRAQNKADNGVDVLY